LTALQAAPQIGGGTNKKTHFTKFGKAGPKNSDFLLAELVTRPQADQIGAIEFQI
jgi:hypothetical protein